MEVLFKEGPLTTGRCDGDEWFVLNRGWVDLVPFVPTDFGPCMCVCTGVLHGTRYLLVAHGSMFFFVEGLDGRDERDGRDWRWRKIRRGD